MSSKSPVLPFSNDFVATLAGKRYFVMTKTGAEGMGGRSWAYQMDPSQEVKPSPLSLALLSFHEGCGFSFAGVPNVYDGAGAPVSSGGGDGWDHSVLARVASWARHGTGASVTLSAAPAKPGWLIQGAADVMYMARGRYLTKYTLSTTPGATWAKTIADFDLTSTNYVPGRIERWDSKLYVPRAATSTGVLQQAYQITVASGASADTRSLLPADKTARGFRKYKQLLMRFAANGVATCATTPTTASNWSDDGGVGTYQAGDPGSNINDVVQWGLYVFAAKDDGIHSYGDDWFTRNELPALGANLFVGNNVPVETLNDQVLIANDGGAARWIPGAKWKHVGPNQEGGWEGDKAIGWGKVVGLIPYGAMTFVVYKDEVNSRGSIVGLYPGKGGRDPIPQMHFQVSSGYFENGCIMSASTGESYLAVIKTGTDGTVAEPWIWRLPKALDGANDSRVPKGVSDTSWTTPRYWAPLRNILKGWQEFEFWADLDCAGDLDDTPGLQVWASVDDGAFFQLNDDTGTAATLKTSGAQRVFFPASADSFGHWVQLKFAVPALGGGEIAIEVLGLRDMVLRGNYFPRSEQLIQATLILSQGEFQDGGSMQRTAKQQRADLEALINQRDEPIAYRDPWGTSGYLTVEQAQFSEIQFQEQTESAFVAKLVFRVGGYS